MYNVSIILVLNFAFVAFKIIFLHERENHNIIPTIHNLTNCEIPNNRDWKINLNYVG